MGVEGLARDFIIIDTVVVGASLPYDDSISNSFGAVVSCDGLAALVCTGACL